MKRFYSFTLVELLVVVGIIVILAGLLLPAVMGGAEQGRITQAKSDMKAILMALNQMETTYQKMVTPVNSKYTFDSQDAQINAKQVDSKDYGFITFGPKGTKVCNNSALSTNEETASKAFIAELCGVSKKTSGTLTFNTNKRKLKFLDSKTGFDPSKGYDDAENVKQLWKDPWGNAYVIMVNTDFSGQIPHPAANESGVYNKKILSAKAIVYSYGPNGEDNQGRNVATGGDKLDDDITSWE